MPLSSKHQQNMRLPSNSSTLSKEEVDLSFDSLCQELLALSASCSTLERLISTTDNKINNGLDSSRQHSASAFSQPKSPTSVTSDSLSSREDDSDSDTLFIDETETVSSSANRTISKSLQQKRSVNLPPSKTKELSSGSHSILLPGKKMAALTVDVGASRSSYQPVVGVPIQGSLITITSPQTPLITKTPEKTEKKLNKSRINESQLSNIRRENISSSPLNAVSLYFIINIIHFAFQLLAKHKFYNCFEFFYFQNFAAFDNPSNSIKIPLRV